MAIKKSHNSSYLTKRDREILDHVARFRLTTNEILQRVLFDGQQPNAVTKVTARLCEHKFLASFPLIYPQQYYRLGERGAALLGLHESRTRPLGPQSLPMEYGVLLYATRRDQPLIRLTPIELRQRFDFFEPAWCEAAHVLRVAGRDAVMELLRVDLGGSADHVARKCFADAMSRWRSEPFQELIRRRAFRCVLISSTTEKAAVIQSSLEKHQWPEGLAVHLATVPDLLPLIPGGDRAA